MLMLPTPTGSETRIQTDGRADGRTDGRTDRHTGLLYSKHLDGILAGQTLYRLTYDTLREVLKNTSFYSLTPPPPIHVGGFYNNIIKFKYYPHRLTPPPLPPLSTFQDFIIFSKII